MNDSSLAAQGGCVTWVPSVWSIWLGMSGESSANPLICLVGGLNLTYTKR